MLFINYFIAIKTFASRALLCLVLLGIAIHTHAQTKNNKYELHYHFVDKDSGFSPTGIRLQKIFTGQASAITYVDGLTTMFRNKGYILFSIDSSWQTETAMHLKIYGGPAYQWMQLKPVGIANEVLESSGFYKNNFNQKTFHLGQWQLLQQRLLNFYENNGYPFAKVYLDSVQLNANKISALLKVEKGVLYHLDSIRIIGSLKLKKNFLQRYLEIPNGSIYKKTNLTKIDKRIKELPYANFLQPSDVSMLGTGAMVNVYADEKKYSQVNFLIGFLPAAGQIDKLQITGDVNLNLNNVFMGGENILIKWQLLQPKSPRLNLGYSQPYFFNSSFGANFLFNLFKKDSSYLQLDGLLGTNFTLNHQQKGKLFVQFQNSVLLAAALDTNAIKAQKKLPENIDVTALNGGLEYSRNNTDYFLNPRKGNDILVKLIVGVKNIKRNQTILNIKEGGFNYASLYDSLKLHTYQLKLQATLAHYFKVAKQTTFKVETNLGLYQSPVIFRNELFQIGGYHLLRGFNEESIFANKYAVFTAEIRQLLSLNSYLYLFTDAGFVQNKWQQANSKNQLVSLGLGISFETKAGLLNLGIAAGKRNDVKFNLRQAAKIHFGYVNYF